jgi:DNA/RNA-binding domain of Phe-tRNA-synthetase-like protein
VNFSVAPDLAAIVRPGVLWLEGATVVEHEHRLDAPLAAVEAAFRLKPEGTSGGRGRGDDVPGSEGGAASDGGFRLAPSPETSAAGHRLGLGGQVEEVRAMYKRVGLDPTKRRPSSEALLRRVRKGDPLPRINSMVDVCNWCSLEFQLPYGLYDAEQIHGDVVLRRGADGESYPGIRKDEVHVGGRITLADDHGPFGNPTSDSARTMVTTSTRKALVVVFAPSSVDTAGLRRVLEATSTRMHEFTAGITCALEIKGGK